MTNTMDRHEDFYDRAECSISNRESKHKTTLDNETLNVINDLIKEHTDRIHDQLMLDFSMRFTSMQDEINKLRSSSEPGRINIKTLSNSRRSPAYDLTNDPLFKTVTATLTKFESDPEESEWDQKLLSIQQKKSTYSSMS